MIPQVKVPRAAAQKTLTFGPWVHGLNLEESQGALAPTELAECLNWIPRDGTLELRPAMRRFTSKQAPADLAGIGWVPLGGGTLLAVTTDKALFRIDGNGAFVLISSSLESSSVAFVPFKGGVLVLDGGHVKILDSSWNLTLAYDGGYGSRGYAWNHLSISADTTQELYSGGTVRVGQRFTMPDIPTGFSIPPVRIEAMLGAVGSPTGPIYGRVRDWATDAVIAEVEIADAGDLPTTGTALFQAPFDSVTAEMDAAGTYIATIEYAGGDASNKVIIDTASTGGADTYTYTTSWTSSGTKAFSLALSPSLPPKGSFGEVWNSRPWVAGDPDNPGLVWFGNLSALDWSTPDGGGYLGAVDDDASSFPVGTMQSLYGALYLFGSPEQPYLSRITGANPSEYQQELMLQRVGAAAGMAVGTGNDIWFSDGTSRIWSLSGVQQYGDLRAHAESESILQGIVSSGGISGMDYYPRHATVVCRTRSPDIYVANINAKTLGKRKDKEIYPWAMWRLYTHDLADSTLWEWHESSVSGWYLTGPSGADPGFLVKPDALYVDCRLLANTADIGQLTSWTWFFGDQDALGFNTVYLRPGSGASPASEYHVIHVAIVPVATAHDNATLYLAASDRHIYQIDEDSYRDLDEVSICPTLRTAMIEAPLSKIRLMSVWCDFSALFGAQGKLMIYTGGAVYASTDQLIFSSAMSDLATVDDYSGVLVRDAEFILDVTQEPRAQYRTNILCDRFHLRLFMFKALGAGARISRIITTYRPMRY